ncbi:ComEC/Rec2 family competence protein [Dyadobacter sp. CY343]|uniref:ComEC/Rec2 family competence protein n=1 Tax=Dyadobacter sp. CY343 TaxID=2907299 RepID=UPI001F3766D0|nr:ComEC/Rec2 family competence protein [Dyadobacter sp. CY343]MCE7060401.1 competence protein ComEC family protein [Dyadobacter sp. CY343]
MFSKAPFVGFVLLFIAGILLGGFFFSFKILSEISSLVLLTIAVISSILCYQFQLKAGTSVSIWLSLICLGAFCRVAAEESRDAIIVSLENSHYTAYEAVIASLPEKRQKTVRFEVEITRILENGLWISMPARGLINIPADADQIPRPGDKIVVKGRLERPFLAMNPEQFDYRKYLRNKGILWTDQLRQGSFAVIHASSSAASLRLWLTGISDWADTRFRENLPDDRSYGLVKAMLLGRRDDLQAEQTDDYIASGSVHILSVSGMHVAIIFLMITTVLGWLKKWRYGKLLYVSIITLLLVFYALATGFSPSVQRATIMCIVFVLAEVSGRKHYSMNTLGISALLILLFDPSALFDVGFQLSYLAMTGIFLFYEPIYSIFNPANRCTKFIWQISALAFAAQLATFPLSIFYFHQFPTYFWLVNPFVIAFTNILLPAALVLLLVSFTNLDWLQWVVNQVVDWSAYLTNISASVPKNLPGYLIENVNLGLLETVLLYAVFLMIWVAYEKREYQYLKYGFALTFVFITLSVSTRMQSYLTTETISFSIPKHTVGGYKYGNKLYLVGDDSFKSDTHAFDFYIKNYAVTREIGETIFISSKPH